MFERDQSGLARHGPKWCRILAMKETTAMTTMTMPATLERTTAAHAREQKPAVSQLMPLLLAIALLAAVAAVSVLISGPMH